MPTIRYINKAGQNIQGVTSIISQNLGWNKGALMGWANRIGRENGIYHYDQSLYEADAGTLAHYYIERLLIKKSKISAPDKGEIIKEIKRLENSLEKKQLHKAEKAFGNFLEWKKNVNFLPLYTEPHLVSEKLQVGATPDCIGRIGEKISLLDWKTGKDLYIDQLVQAAAYQKIWNENYPSVKTKRIDIIRFGKNNDSFDHKYRKELKKEWQVFKTLLKLKKLRKELN